MQVLGDLIKLPSDAVSLPLPWWQRAPLGLLHGTDVHVGLVKGSRPVGDIVVSVLDINKWHNMLRLDCSHVEERGVLAGLMEAVLPLNIALAEAVTTETGKEHHATLFCEDKGILKINDVIPRIQEMLKKSGFRDIHLDPYLSAIRLPILESTQTRINHGWLRPIPFMSWIQKHYDESSRQIIDLNQAVVSADTDNRLLRYVFPNRGAKTIKIKHTDKPGALRAILNEFTACELNVLSALLRRGGQQAGYAELIAVCEPKAAQNPIEVYDRLRIGIGNIAPEFDPAAHFADARPADKVIYLPPPNQVTPPGRRPVFFASRHAEEGERQLQVSDQVRKTLRELRWWLLEAAPNAPARADDSSHTCSLMERSDAAVVLVTGFGCSDVEMFKLDLLHELGYLRALRKPVLILTDAGGLGLLERWAGPARATCLELPLGNAAFSPDEPAGLLSILRNWSTTSAWERR